MVHIRCRQEDVFEHGPTENDQRGFVRRTQRSSAPIDSPIDLTAAL